MESMQKWFEMIAGFTPHERERYEFAREFFGRQPFDSAALHTPACWRRRPLRGHVAGSAARYTQRAAPR